MYLYLLLTGGTIYASSLPRLGLCICISIFGQMSSTGSSVQRPARKQATRRADDGFDGGGDYNIWYHKRVGQRKDTKIKAETRCNIANDSVRWRVCVGVHAHVLCVRVYLFNCVWVCREPLKHLGSVISVFILQRVLALP